MYPLPKGYFAQRTAIASGNQLIVEACPLPLAPVTSADGTIGNRSVTLTWDVPFIHRGRASNYVIEYSRDSGEWTRVRKARSAKRSFRVKGLSNGSSYRFRIAATNVTGTGPWLETDPFVPHTTPGTPQSFTVTPGDQHLTLSWAPPTNDGGAPILDYRVQYSPPSGGWITWDDGVGTGTSTTITGLANGRKYRVRVQAVNDAGRGASTVIRTRRPTAS
jgi:titin